METDRLRYFCAIVDTGSLTQASEILGVSHSGLSKAMSVLQSELGFKLLTPHGRGLELTEKGKTLYQQSKQIIEMVNALKASHSSPKETSRIGLPEVLALAVSERFAREFKEGVTLEDVDSGEIENRVLDRRNDFGFTFIPFPHKELDHLKMTQVTLSSFALAGRFRGQDAETIPYVIPSSEIKENPLSLRVRDGWNSNLARFTPYRANSLSIALQMVQSGSCAIYTQNFLVAHLNASAPKDRRLIELDLSTQRKARERTRRDIFLVKRRSDDESKIMKTAVRLVKLTSNTEP